MKERLSFVLKSLQEEEEEEEVRFAERRRFAHLSQPSPSLHKLIAIANKPKRRGGP